MTAYKCMRGKPGKGLLPNLPDETMVCGRMRIDTDGKKEAKKYSFTRSGTGREFRDGMMIGNGDFGASMHGMPDNLTFNIAKNDLWWDDFDAPVPCYPDCGIEGVRKMAAAGDPELKLQMFACSNRRSNHPIQTGAARLTLHLISGAVACCVREELNQASGYAQQWFSCGDTNGIINGSDFSVTANVSPFDEVMRITAEGPRASENRRLGQVRFELTRDPMEVATDIGPITAEEIERREEEIDRYYTQECFAEDGYFGFNMRLRSGPDPETAPDRHYTVMAKTDTDCFRFDNIRTSVLGLGRVKESFSIYLTVVSTYDAEDTMAEAKRRLDTAILRNPYHIFMNGTEYFEVSAKRSWIRLPEKEYARPWYFGLYEAESARRPGKFLPGYTAPWSCSSYVNWGYHILTYEESKANLGLLATNHAELLEPLFRMCLDAQEKLHAFTKGFYHMEGTAYPHAISGTGTVIASSVTLNGTMMNLSPTGEIVKFAWDYYDYTGDRDFLAQIGYPLLREAALFYSNYLQTDADGRKYIFPSHCQEYTEFPNAFDDFMTNSVVDLAMFRLILRRALQAADILGVDEALSARWKDDLAGLGDEYPVWPDGTWRMSEDAAYQSDKAEASVYGPPGHTGLAPLNLSDEVDCWNENDPLREAAVRTARKVIPDKKLPWDLSYSLLARMRIGDRDMLERLPLFKEGGNLNRADAMDYDSEQKIAPDGQQSFYVDKGSAYLSEAITEMLLQSHCGTIHVFPAFPFDLGDAAFFSLRARGAFLVSAESRNGETAYVIIRSLRGNPCRVYDPFGADVRIRDLETGEAVPFTSDGAYLSFETVPEHEYALDREAHPLESYPVLR